MIDRAFAVRLVQAQLERESPGELVVVGVRRHELAWIVSYQSVEYVRTKDLRHMLIGNGPYLVDRVDGSLHDIGVVSSVSGAWEADYRTRIRNLPVRTAVDDLHDEVRRTAAARGRAVAMRRLRTSVPALAPAEALAYVTALEETGRPVPSPLLAVATRTLVPVLDPVLRVHTIRPGRPVDGDDTVRRVSARHDWSKIPAPSVLAAGVAFQTAVFAACGLPPQHAPQPAFVAYDDGGGSSLVLDLGADSPVLVLVDHDERDELLSPDAVTAALGPTALTGPYARNDSGSTYTGAARWDGSRWAPALGVPGRVAAYLADDGRQLTEADQALGDLTEGETDEAALTALLDALRAGDWDEDTVEAALRCTPYEDDEELAGRPDGAVAHAVLEGFRPALRRAGGLREIAAEGT